MFRVENADFIAEKLASELLENQEFREVEKNAHEAIERRYEAQGVSSGGRIEFDVDWSLFENTGNWYVAAADNGDGMSRSELERYTTTLAVQGAGGKQSIAGNQGMGLKISGPTRHKKGVLIRSMKDGERSMVQIGWDGDEYGLIPLGPDGELVVSVAEEMFPEFIREQGSGTVVTFLGNDDDEDSFIGPTKGWLFKYLNQRFFRLGHDGIEVLVRVPAGDPDDWPSSRAEADDRQRGKGKSFNLTRVKGTASVWDDAADRQGDEFRGVVELPGDPGAGIPPAVMHWWVHPSGPGIDVTSRTFGGGTLAVLFQGELHDWRTSTQANPFFARVGILFGKSRVSLVIEPRGGNVASDFARAHVLVDGRPVFESEAWPVWADQFRDPSRFPDRIKKTMAEEQARLDVEDPDRIKRIRDRLKDVMKMLRPRRFQPRKGGDQRASGPEATGPGAGHGPTARRPTGGGGGSGKKQTRGVGAVLTQVDEEDGKEAQEIFSVLNLEPQWVNEADAEGIAIVNGNDHGLHDRAAALAGEDGRTASVLLLNREFRGFQALLAAVNEWANPDGDEEVAKAIETYAQEWVEQKMIEAVNGLRQLENGSSWLTAHYDDALSPVGLTAVFMADRYHTFREIKRQVGPLRRAAKSA